MNTSAINNPNEMIIWILTVFLFASFCIFDESSWISLILAGITLIILLVDAIQGNGRIKIPFDKYQKLVLAFCGFCYLSAIWAWDSNLAIEKGTTILEILICTSVIYSHYCKFDSVALLINAVMWAGYIVAIYACFFYGIGTITNTALSGNRLESGFTNINNFGMICAISVVITLFNILFVNFRFQWGDLLAIPTIVLVGISGSRKAIIIVILGILLLLLKKFGSKNVIKSVISFSLIGLIFLISLRFLKNLTLFETVNERMMGLLAYITGEGSIDSSTVLRQRYVELGIEQFKKTPILGIGINNARLIINAYVSRDTYLHNNYVELLADGGIVGFLSYYSIYIILVYSMIKNRIKADSYFVLSSVLLIIMLLMDFGSVSYYSKCNYFYLMIVFLEDRIVAKTNL